MLFEAVLKGLERAPAVLRHLEMHAGAELDLLTTIGGHRVGFEYKVGDALKRTRSMAITRQDLNLDRLFVVAPVAKPYTLTTGIDVVPLADAIDAVSGEKPCWPAD